ncbi:hypothetical protein KXV85_005621, partial [Aspergillus fumigatus]
DIKFIGDVNRDKFGSFTPGTLIPILSEAELFERKPDYTLVLPWHFRPFFTSNDKFRALRLSVSIPWAKPVFWGDEERYVTQALQSSWISGGPYIEQFERALANYLRCKHAIAVSNGTSALHLAYLALGLKAGDEIVTPAFGFMAAAN